MSEAVLVRALADVATAVLRRRKSLSQVTGRLNSIARSLYARHLLLRRNELLFMADQHRAEAARLRLELEGLRETFHRIEAP